MRAITQAYQYTSEALFRIESKGFPFSTIVPDQYVKGEGYFSELPSGMQQRGSYKFCF